MRKRKQQEPRVSAVFWIETMLAEQGPDPPGDTTIPSLANRLGGRGFAPQPFYRSPQRDGCDVAQVVGETIQADARRQGNNGHAARAQNAVNLFQTAVVGGQVLEHAQADDVVKTGVQKRERFGIRAQQAYTVGCAEALLS